MTDTVIESGAVLERAIIDKHSHIGQNAHIGGGVHEPKIHLSVVGKNSIVPDGMVIEAGGTISTDVIESDYGGGLVKENETIFTQRKPYEI